LYPSASLSSFAWSEVHYFTKALDAKEVFIVRLLEFGGCGCTRVGVP
jgi:hypothetical protein